VIEIQRARILTTMSEVCSERGAGNVTVAHVVERAGVSRRTFYELFSDREDCFLAAFDEAVTNASRYVFEGYDPRARWAERVRRALTGLLLFLDVERGAGRLLIVSSLGAGAGALERRGHVLDRMITLIDEGRTETKTGDGPSRLTAEGIVGGTLSILHARLLDPSPPFPVGSSASLPVQRSRSGDLNEGSLLGLRGLLMSMIVLPYLGTGAARRELARPEPKRTDSIDRVESSPLMQLEMRLTYRTVRVLMAIATRPGSSNRQVAETSGITDQGQMSKLLARLQGLGLIENTWTHQPRGTSNAWTLTPKGTQIQSAINRQTNKDVEQKVKQHA
jgi:AcrR family transcriptional regulator/DNA-binding MarR family transcriptional regulator